MKKNAADTLKKLDRLAILISLVVTALVVLMGYMTIEIPWDLSFLPSFHALLNTMNTLILAYAWQCAREKRVEDHRRAISVALIISVVFLLSYVAYHFTNEPVRYGGEGNTRVLYFSLLISHIVLAALSLPCILFAVNRAITGHIERHKKITTWLMPIWIYVSATGPICHFMLMPYR